MTPRPIASATLLMSGRGSDSDKSDALLSATVASENQGSSLPQQHVSCTRVGVPLGAGSEVSMDLSEGLFCIPEMSEVSLHDSANDGILCVSRHSSGPPEISEVSMIIEEVLGIHPSDKKLRKLEK